MIKSGICPHCKKKVRIELQAVSNYVIELSKPRKRGPGWQGKKDMDQLVDAAEETLQELNQRATKLDAKKYKELKEADEELDQKLDIAEDLLDKIDGKMTIPEEVEAVVDLLTDRRNMKHTAEKLSAILGITIERLNKMLPMLIKEKRISKDLDGMYFVGGF